MQVHDYAASQVLFAFNHWNAGAAADLGFGNYTNPATADGRRKQLWKLHGQIAPGLRTACEQRTARHRWLVWDRLHERSSEFQHSGRRRRDECFVLDAISGLTVSNAAIDPLSRQFVTLTTATMTPGVTYTAIVNNVHDRSSSNSAIIATNSLATFQGPAVNGVFNNVSDATNYSLVYSLEHSEFIGL